MTARAPNPIPEVTATSLAPELRHMRARDFFRRAALGLPLMPPRHSANQERRPVAHTGPGEAARPHAARIEQRGDGRERPATRPHGGDS